jgi:hypothetical protein
MSTFLYPQVREMQELGPTLAASTVKIDPILDRVFPVVKSNAPMLQWSVDADDLGLQQLRGLDGGPLGVTRLGKTHYVERPGYYGEFQTITETELTERAGSVMGDVNVDVGDLVAGAYRQLNSREATRIRKICWDLLTTGTFTVNGKESTLVHTGTYTLQTYSASDWSTTTTSTPLADFRAVQDLGPAYGTNFGSNAIAVMNRKTANYLFSSTTATDIFSRRTMGGGTVMNKDEVNRVLLGEDLPQIAIMDDRYKDDSGTLTKFLIDDKVIVMGVRETGDQIGQYRFTRNLNNPGGAPGHYEYIKDYANGINAPKQTPPKIEIHAGHNGGPVLLRPGSIVVMSV